MQTSVHDRYYYIVIFTKLIVVKDVGTGSGITGAGCDVLGIIWFWCSQGASKTKLVTRIAVSQLFAGNRFPQKSLVANRVTTWTLLCLLQSNKYLSNTKETQKLQPEVKIFVNSWFMVLTSKGRKCLKIKR